MTAPADLLVVHAAELATLATGSVPRRGAALADPGIVADGAVAASGGRITAVGPTEAVLRSVSRTPATTTVDASGRLVTPGLVDPHTHLVFAGHRAQEFTMRLHGAGYAEIDLVAMGRRRLDRMLAHGTTTVEAKSGYGLSMADELKILRATARLGASHAVGIVPTFLGAHAVPPERKADPDGYVRDVCELMLPAVVREGLAEFCDVFCERGAFSIEQSRRILSAAGRLGLRLKIHADQLSASGGARLAAELGALSADHLEHTPSDDLAAMAERGVTAGLLPGATFFLLHQNYADARAMVELGVPIALATDFNPGSSPTFSMQMAIALGCIGMRLTPAEALSAATINAAHAVGRAADAGSLAPGKRADLVIWGISSVAELPLHFGTNMADTVIVDGRVVIGGGRTT
ncbi:MAG: imidazolonepropionase [Bacillati bacterium ANGP1]|uniref:Imidazolonepropionase n=1 Tax=Candidatus Segetimicrobium genomatis TaxID=2569760 RepID=A0A537JIJ5_9BACT|nr:MAG: imidazolonepropionase [Terrabacteria group bacterium ANGP1]